MLKTNAVYLGDCLDIMPHAEDKSIDMIFCDLPYGMTQCQWDTPIDLDKLWGEYKRIIKPNGIICLTASQPFTSRLVSSNYEMFRCEWIYGKTNPSNFANAKKMPMKWHENVVIFSTSNKIFYPIMEERTGEGKTFVGKIKPPGSAGSYMGKINRLTPKPIPELRYPNSVQKFKNSNNGKDSRLHPAQKPVKLAEYFIRTYSQPGEIILDNCIGSGTTAIAAINVGRKFIGIEKEQKYYDIAINRIRKHLENR